MIGWLVLVALIVLIVAALWRFSGLPRSALEMAAAALVLGAVGYGWQGSPDFAGHPMTAQEERMRGDTTAMEARKHYLSAYDNDVAWINFSEALIRAGKTQEAVIAARSGIAKAPRNSALWVNLGNALVAHAQGNLTAPAKLAFERAQALAAAGDPAPRFFYGLALAESGQLLDARKLWRALLDSTPLGAPWRKDLTEKLTVLDAFIARGPA